jgi:hypothetical protein
MSRIQFEEDQVSGRTLRAVPAGSLSRFLMRYGIVTSPQAASVLLFVVMIIGLMVIVYNMQTISTPPPPSLESMSS